MMDSQKQNELWKINTHQKQKLQPVPLKMAQKRCVYAHYLPRASKDILNIFGKNNLQQTVKIIKVLKEQIYSITFEHIEWSETELQLATVQKYKNKTGKHFELMLSYPPHITDQNQGKTETNFNTMSKKLLKLFEKQFAIASQFDVVKYNCQRS